MTIKSYLRCFVSFLSNEKSWKLLKYLAVLQQKYTLKKSWGGKPVLYLWTQVRTCSSFCSMRFPFWQIPASLVAAAPDTCPLICSKRICAQTVRPAGRNLECSAITFLTIVPSGRRPEMNARNKEQIWFKYPARRSRYCKSEPHPKCAYTGIKHFWGT